MSRRNVDIFVTREISDGKFAVIWQVKSFGSIGPDPGRVEHESTVVEDVSREYADMVERELTKDNFAGVHEGVNIFNVADTLTRRIDTFAGDNPHFAECIKTNAIY